MWDIQHGEQSPSSWTGPEDGARCGPRSTYLVGKLLKKTSLWLLLWSTLSERGIRTWAKEILLPSTPGV